MMLSLFLLRDQALDPHISVASLMLFSRRDTEVGRAARWRPSAEALSVIPAIQGSKLSFAGDDHHATLLLQIIFFLLAV